MKKKVNLVLLLIIAAVLVWGGIATAITVSTTNSKTRSASYSKSGKRYVTYEISKEEESLYIYKEEDGKTEYITTYEYYKRYEKHTKLVMEKAKKNRDANDTTENTYIYNNAKSSYVSAKTTRSQFAKTLVILGTTTFFGTYCTIAALFGVALIVNNKLNYEKRD